MSRALLGLSLGLALCRCATTDGDEGDPFVPPSRPLMYGAECPTGPGPRAKKLDPKPYGELPRKVKLSTQAGEPVEGAIVVVHGGAGSPATVSDGPTRAAKLALEHLEAGAAALDAAIDATADLEDDPRFNAGTGANIRIDGKTIQMDASLMTSDGAFAAVAVIERVKNPIRVARAVLETPHILLAGEGATRFAHKMGFEDVVPISKESEARYQEKMKRLREDAKKRGGNYEFGKWWNFPNPPPPELTGVEHGDTVGAVARDRDGKFAVTLSTGGTSFTLYGRVGDVPIFGAGGFAGPDGAVACTGDGEVIVREMLARTVYEKIASGVPAKDAVAAAAAGFEDSNAVGIIAVDRIGYGVASNRSMAFGVAYEQAE